MLDFDERAIRGTVTTTFAALFEEVHEVTFDAAELAIEAVTLVGATGTGHAEGTADGTVTLAFWTEEEQLHVRLDRPYRHGEAFAICVRYCARTRLGLHFVAPIDGDAELPLQAL